MRLIESVATDIWHIELGMGIRGDMVNVALNLLEGGFTGLTQILTSYKKTDQGFIGREIINNDSYAISLIRISFTAIQTGMRIIGSIIRPSVVTIA